MVDHEEFTRIVTVDVAEPWVVTRYTFPPTVGAQIYIETQTMANDTRSYSSRNYVWGYCKAQQPQLELTCTNSSGTTIAPDGCAGAHAAEVPPAVFTYVAQFNGL